MSCPWRLGIAMVCLAAVAWSVFGSLASAHFVAWDDPDMLAQNPDVIPASWSKTAQFWLRPENKLYTPVAYTLWSAVVAAENPPPGHSVPARAFHVLNLILHILAAWACFLLLTELVGSPAAAWGGAALFLVHPFQVEPVAWIAGMNNELFGALSLAALWQLVVYLKRGGRPHLIIATVLYTLALLSKPTAVVVPFMAAALALWILKRPIKSIAVPLGIWAGMATCIAVVAKISQPPDPNPHPPMAWRPWIAVDAIGFYAVKLIAPFNLTIDYERTPYWLTQHPAAAWPGVVVIVLAIVLYFGRFRASILPPLGIALIALGPVLGFVVFDFQDYSTTANRYMYLPMFGIALLLAQFLARYEGIVPWTLAGAALFLLAIVASNQIAVWQDTQALVNRQLAFDPDSSTGHGILGNWLAATGNNAQAVKEYRITAKALSRERKSGTPSFWQGYGNSLWLAGHQDEAVSAYQTAVKLIAPPDRAQALDNLGMAYLAMGDVASARQSFNQALEISPNDPIAQKNLAHLPAP
jgi:protein O-mannosyl-transferase